jgi:hypothetical protein
MVSLAISGNPRTGAIARDRVVFPLAGGPDTTTKTPDVNRSPTQALWLVPPQPDQPRTRAHSNR